MWVADCRYLLCHTVENHAMNLRISPQATIAQNLLKLDGNDRVLKCRL